MGLAYLGGWFLLDFISTMGAVLARLVGDSFAFLRNLRIIRLIRLLKLLRMAKMKKILDSIIEGVGPEMAVLAAFFKLFCIMLFITHVCGYIV
jgi:hyperpolarization activated cyclic nucleotide-gated potassium channel 2